MRRVAVTALVGVCSAPLGARAAPTTVTVTAEGGGEADTNVERVETGPGLDTARRAAPVVRLGARLDVRGHAGKGAFAALGSALARVVGTGVTPAENVVLVAADLRYLHPLGARPVSAGVALAGADALPVSVPVGARTFATAGADALLVLRDGRDPEPARALTLTAGPRAFRYQPNHDFDWVGLAVAARLDLTLWQSADATRSLELASTAGFEARRYASTAFANACASDAMPTLDCFAPTTTTRHDRYEHAGADLTYSGAIVAAVGYQATVIDSNSFGQSIVRHRITASATTGLPGHFIGTALATLQLDSYLDGLLLQKDLQFQELTSLDDVNRSSLQLRISRGLSRAWSAEGRAAIWRDVGTDTRFTEYRRELLYLGAVYSH